jgi:hypothetical protein
MRRHTVVKDLTGGLLFAFGASKKDTLDKSSLAVDLLNIKDLAREELEGQCEG